jgi:hypothetical protein
MSNAPLRKKRPPLPAPKPAPVIASLGDPPEAHARRIVIEMTKYLVGERDRLDGLMADAAAVTRSSLRNPTSQIRFCNRFRRAAPTGLLDVRVEPGKKQFKLIFACWEVFDPARRKFVLPRDSMPDRLWLGCAHHTIRFQRGHNAEHECVLIFAVSRHAMQRLATRRQARTVEDMLSAVRQLWEAIEPRLHEPFDGRTWFAPVAGGFAVIEWSEDIKTSVTVTVIDADMLPHDAAARARRLAQRD